MSREEFNTLMGEKPQEMPSFLKKAVQGVKKTTGVDKLVTKWNTSDLNTEKVIYDGVLKKIETKLNQLPITFVSISQVNQSSGYQQLVNEQDPEHNYYVPEPYKFQ